MRHHSKAFKMQSTAILLVFILHSNIFAAATRSETFAVNNKNEINSQSSGSLSKEVFYIQSPNYPGEYEGGSDHSWMVIKSDWTVCAITLVIRDFQLSGSCQDNYLSVGDQTLCQTVSSRRLEMKLTNNPSAKLEIRFRTSKSAGRGHGFNIMAIQHPHTCVGPLQPLPVRDCSKTLSDHEGIFGVSEYLNHSLKLPMKDCVFSFERPSSPGSSYCGIRFRFLSFDLGSDCDFDNLYVRGKRYCGQQLLKEDFIVPYPNDTSKELQLILNIRSEAFTGEGFIASYQRIERDCPVICSKQFAETSFRIRSSGQPYYDHNADCDYTVRKANTDIRCLRVTVNRLDLAGADASCSTDYLRLFGGRRICASSQLSSPTFKVSFPVRRSVLTSKFHSDASGSSTGFDIDVQQLKTSCPPDRCQKISGSTVVTTPGYPDAYPKNLQCEYFVERSRDEPMEIVMYKVNYRMSATSALTIPGGRTVDQVFANNDTYPLSLLNNFAMNFRSFTTVDSGFQIFVHEYPANLDSCSFQADHTDVRGSFRTPEYSAGVYPASVSCVITIARYADNCKVVLTVKDFEMAPPDPSSGDCADYIDWSRDGKKCGTLTLQQFGNVEIPFGEGQNKVFIKFFSDSNKDDNGKGVNFEYEQSSENC